MENSAFSQAFAAGDCRYYAAMVCCTIVIVHLLRLGYFLIIIPALLLFPGCIPFQVTINTRVIVDGNHPFCSHVPYLEA